jgi:hypothetical protein
VAYAADTAVVDAWLARLRGVKAATRANGPHIRHLTIEGRFEEQVDVSAPPEVFALLAPDPLRFRERSMLSFARFDVRRLQRTVGKSTQQVTTDDGATWRTPSGEPVNAPAIAQIVFALSDLHAGAFVEAPSGAPAVTLAIDVQPPGEARPIRHNLELWSRNGGPIGRLDADATFTIAPATFDVLGAELLQKSN